MGKYFFKEENDKDLIAIDLSLIFNQDHVWIMANGNPIVKIVVNDLGEIAVCGLTSEGDYKILSIVKPCLSDKGWKPIN